jgi:hypothetical protein
MKAIRTKPKNNAMIAKVGKGNSLVILPIKQYETKIQSLLNENKFKISNTDPTKNVSESSHKNNKTRQDFHPTKFQTLELCLTVLHISHPVT